MFAKKYYIYLELQLDTRGLDEPDKVTIFLDHVESLRRSPNDKHTSIVMTSGDSYVVKEKPEHIIDAINKTFKALEG